MTFSIAAASRSLGRLMPATSPATYAILTLSCLLYGVSLLATIKQSGMSNGGGSLGGLMNLGGIGHGGVDSARSFTPTSLMIYTSRGDSSPLYFFTEV